MVTHRYPPDGVGGVERYVERLGKALGERGDNVTVLTRTPAHLPRRPRLDREHGVYRIVGSGVRLREFLVEHALVEAAFETVLRETRPDVVHVNHLIGISPRVVAIARSVGVPAIVSAHDYFLACPLVHLVKTDGRLCAGPDEGRECAATCFADESDGRTRWTLRYAYFRELLELASCVVSPSDRLAVMLESLAPRARLEVIPLGVDPSAQAETLPSEALSLAHVGTAARHKGLFRIVEALQRAQLPRVRLLVLGRFDDRREQKALWRAAAQVPGLELDLRGEYDARGLPHLLAGVDAVVAASEVPEAFPLAPREALAAGVPVVTVALGGLADVVEPDVNGLVAAALDDDELAAALRRLALEPGLLARLRDGARRTVVPTFADHVESLRTLYGRVLAESEPQPVDAFERLHHDLLDAGFGRRRR